MPAGTPITVPAIVGTFINNPPFNQIGFTDQSLNVLIREDELQTRPGLNQVGQNLNEIVLGFAPPCRDTSDQTVLIAATNLHWWKLNMATDLYTNIANVALTQALMPTTFTYFFQGAHQYMIGVNDKDPTKEFDITQNTVFATIAAAPIGRTCATVANRVVIGNLLYSGTRFPNDVQWSSVADRTSWPAIARNTLPDTADNIMAIRTLGRNSAAILMERSQWIMQAQLGSDAAAFSFTVMDHSPGPIGPAACDIGPGGMQVVYLGEDGNIWSFNGVQSQMIYQTQRYIAGRVNFVTKYLTAVAYQHAQQEIWISIALDGDFYPTHLLIYSYKNSQVYIQQTPSTIPVTAMGLCICELSTPTNQLPDVPTNQLPDIPTNFLGVSSKIEELIMGNTVGTYHWEGTLDAGSNIFNDWRLLMPVIPGSNYVFDGLEIMAEPMDAQSGAFTVSVQLGPAYDNLTETILGVLDPSDSATLSITNVELNGRVVVVRITGNGYLKIRRLEVRAWEARVMI